MDSHKLVQTCLLDIGWDIVFIMYGRIRTLFLRIGESPHAFEFFLLYEIKKLIEVFFRLPNPTINVVLIVIP